MDTNETDAESPSQAARSILANLPDELQIAQVLRALICAEEAGYQRALRTPAAVALANLRLSSTRPV